MCQRQRHRIQGGGAIYEEDNGRGDAQRDVFETTAKAQFRKANLGRLLDWGRLDG